MIKSALLCAGLILTGVKGLTPTRSPTQNFSIETSTVQQDLACFYHNQYPVNTFTYLIPNTKNGDLYNDFKLLTMYANQGDLYIYFYAESAFTFNDVRLEYSISTTLNSDNTEVVEDWHEKGQAFQCTVHDVNGGRKKFYKVVAENFYDYEVGDKHRVKAKRLLCYQDDEYHQMIRSCENAEYSWIDQDEGEDQVYTYYKDNYLIVPDAKYVQQLLPTKYSNVSQSAATEVRELNWLFFTYDYSSLGVNYALGKLKEITLNYEYIDYNTTYRIDGANNGTAYYGALNHAEPFLNTVGHKANSVNFDVNSTKRIETTVTPSTRTIDQVTDQATIFFFWNIAHRIKYTYNTIQALDETSINNIADADFKGFLQRNVENYKWAVDFREDTRSVIKTEKDQNGIRDWFAGTIKVTTNCHEARSVVATRFVFENQDGTAELNGIMNPVEISELAFTSPATYTTVSFTLGSEKATRTFWIVIGVIAGLALIIGNIFLVRKIKKAKSTTNNYKTTKVYVNNNNKKFKPKKHYHKRR